MLTSFNPNDTVFLGCRFKPQVTQGYMNGGAGNKQIIISLCKYKSRQNGNKLYITISYFKTM